MGELMIPLKKTEIVASDVLGVELIQLLKDQYSRDLTNTEFQAFVYVCASTRLDPLKKQIYAVKREGKMVIQVGIDGFRAIAFRSNAYAGRDETAFDYDGDKLVRAKVTVYKLVGGHRCPFTATANWAEFCPSNPKNQFMWKKMPEVMLGKCAEAQALRMAFPEELSGLYTETEMEQADRGVDTKAQIVRDVVSTEKETEPVMESDLAEFEVTFGKFGGLRLKEIPLNDLTSYVSYLETESERRRRPLEGRGLELVQAIRGFLEEAMTKPKVVK